MKNKEQGWHLKTGQRNNIEVKRRGGHEKSKRTEVLKSRDAYEGPEQPIGSQKKKKRWGKGRVKKGQERSLEVSLERKKKKNDSKNAWGCRICPLPLVETKVTAWRDSKKKGGGASWGEKRGGRGARILIKEKDS